VVLWSDSPTRNPREDLPVFAREGYALIAGAAVISLLLIVISWQFGPLVRVLGTTLGVVITAFTLWFFRDPGRTAPEGSSNLLLAPADGKVVEIVDEIDSLYIKGPVQRVSIFLSPLNVHVNRAPADGVIEFDQYVEGDYLVAWHPKASEKNERSQLGLRHPSGVPVLFKQIAGAVARRVVYHVSVGDTVRAGERFGIVKFGSRMDVLVPPAIPLSVQVGDRVVAGETVIGDLRMEVSDER
jgi:phosphatidylserine decarboxylase